jgi:hypothetical protein
MVQTKAGATHSAWLRLCKEAGRMHKAGTSDNIEEVVETARRRILDDHKAGKAQSLEDITSHIRNALREKPPIVIDPSRVDPSG